MEHSYTRSSKVVHTEIELADIILFIPSITYGILIWESVGKSIFDELERICSVYRLHAILT